MKDFAVDITLVQDDAKLIYNGIALGAQNVISDCNLLNHLSNGAKPFILGASPMSDNGDVFWNPDKKYDGFMSAELGDENGDFSEHPIKFRIRAKDDQLISSIIVFFDKTAEQWAEELKIDNVAFKNNKYYAAFLLEPKKEHILEITKWNKSWYPVRITAIVTGYAETYDDARIRSVKWTKALYDDNAKPYFGLTSAYGELELADRDGIVENLAALSVIDRMSDCMVKEVHAGADDSTGKTNFKYLTDRFKMNFGDNFFKVTLTDAIEKLRNINYGGYALTDTENTALGIFNSLKKCAADNKITLSCNDKNLENIKLKYAYLPTGTLYDAVKEFCILIGGTAYTQNDNAIVINKFI